MSKEQHFQYSNTVILYPFILLLMLWIVFWFQIRIDSTIKNFGIHPQKIEGLLGVFTSPFLHGNITHLYHNSIPLFVLSVALFYFYKKIAWQVILWGVIISGGLTWLIAQQGNHIGASGLIYVLVSFIFFKGVFAKHYRLIALSLLVIFFYGSMIWYIFPIKTGMSWEGHLSGLITGFIFALVFRKTIPKPERYVWETETYNEEEDLFMKHFDENGNFIETDIKDNNENENDNKEVPIKVNYIYKSNKDH